MTKVDIASRSVGSFCVGLEVSINEAALESGSLKISAGEFLEIEPYTGVCVLLSIEHVDSRHARDKKFCCRVSEIVVYDYSDSYVFGKLLSAVSLSEVLAALENSGIRQLQNEDALIYLTNETLLAIHRDHIERIIFGGDVESATNSVQILDDLRGVEAIESLAAKEMLRSCR